MALRIRLARGGAKKRPFYRIIVADRRAARDGRFVEKIGTYNPMLTAKSEERVQFDSERAKYWLSQGASASDRVAGFFAKAGLMEAVKRRNLIKGKPGKKAEEREATRLQREEDAAKATEEARLEAAKVAEEVEAAEAEAPPAETAADEAPAPEAADAEPAAKAEESAAETPTEPEPAAEPVAEAKETEPPAESAEAKPDEGEKAEEKPSGDASS